MICGRCGLVPKNLTCFDKDSSSHTDWIFCLNELKVALALAEEKARMLDAIVSNGWNIWKSNDGRWYVHDLGNGLDVGEGPTALDALRRAMETVHD